MGLVPRARGRTFGREIVRQHSSCAHAAGAERIVLAVDAENLPAIKMYNDTGFTAWDRRTVFVRFAIRAITSARKHFFHAAQHRARKNFSSRDDGFTINDFRGCSAWNAQRRQLFPRDFWHPFDTTASRRRIVDSGDSRRHVCGSFERKLLARMARRSRRPFLWVALVSPIFW